MANKKKAIFAEMRKELEANKVVDPKPVAQIEEKKYFLIVCEGANTEPLYFEKLKALLPNHLLETIEVDGYGANTISIVRAAIANKKKREKNPILPPFDEVWAVFDKDDFPEKNYNSAVTIAQQNNIEAGVTNEAFELWYLLHFQYLDTALKRDQYVKILSKVFKFKYEKSKDCSRKAVEFVFKHGNVKMAIRNARKLEKLHDGKSPSHSCPYTRVHVLVEKIMAYAQSEY